SCALVPSFLVRPRPPHSSLFPYTTLFRSPSFRHIEFWELFPVTHCPDHVFCHMRLVGTGSQIHPGAHLLRLNRHTERHAVIFKASLFVDRLCKTRHHPGICMRLRQIDLNRFHQLFGNHIHHTARADTRRTVRLLSGKYRFQSFFWCQHFFSLFFLLCDVEQTFRKAHCLHCILRIAVGTDFIREVLGYRSPS